MIPGIIHKHFDPFLSSHVKGWLFLSALTCMYVVYTHPYTYIYFSKKEVSACKKVGIYFR